MDQVRERAEHLLCEHGVENEAAAQVADVLLDAQMHSNLQYGLTLLPHLLTQLRRGHIDPAAKWTVQVDADALLLLVRNFSWPLFPTGPSCMYACT